MNSTALSRALNSGLTDKCLPDSSTWLPTYLVNFITSFLEPPCQTRAVRPQQPSTLTAQLKAWPQHSLPFLSSPPHQLLVAHPTSILILGNIRKGRNGKKHQNLSHWAPPTLWSLFHLRHSLSLPLQHPQNCRHQSSWLCPLELDPSRLRQTTGNPAWNHYDKHKHPGSRSTYKMLATSQAWPNIVQCMQKPQLRYKNE